MTWVCGFTICFCNVVVCGWDTVLRTVGEKAEGRQEVGPTKGWGVKKKTIHYHEKIVNFEK